MKNYLIGTLVVIILALSSIIYKNETSPRKRFPVLEKTEKSEAEVPCFLYVFFSKRNCHDCLEIMDVLNSLPPYFIVMGIVPDSELKEEKELRNITGAAFPLVGGSKYKKFIPWYTPSIVGVSPSGDVIFTLPGVPGGKAYLENFLESLYGKVYPVFLKEKLEHERR